MDKGPNSSIGVPVHEFDFHAPTHLLERPREKRIPNRSIPPVGQRAKKRFEEYLNEFVEFAKLHGMDSKLTSEQAKGVAVLLLRLQTFWQKT